MLALNSVSPLPSHSYTRDAQPNLPPGVSQSVMQIRSVKSQALRQKYATPSESSDDEDIAPIKLSAEAQAILGEGQSQTYSDKENADPRLSTAKSTRFAEQEQSQRRSPVSNDDSPYVRPPRRSPPALLERDGSFAYKVRDKNKSFTISEQESKTPAPRLRKIRVSGSRSQTKSPSSTDTDVAKVKQWDAENYKSPDENDSRLDAENGEELNDPYTVSRPKRNKETGIHSTIRTNRIGTGTLLRGHVRRGVLRRHGDDEDMRGPSPSYSPEPEQGRRAEAELDNQAEDLLIDYDSPRPKRVASRERLSANDELQRADLAAGKPSERPTSPSRKPRLSPSTDNPQPTPAAMTAVAASSRSSGSQRPQFKIPALPPIEPSADQENEPPPTFKRFQPVQTSSKAYVGDNVQKEEQKTDRAPRALESPSRQPLAARSHNTPHRPAPPPPPKMSLVEAATSNAGNSRAKKSVHYVLNGRTYRRLDLIGKGGSSRVFRIMAENYKIFALKRVNLEEADMAAIAGYKGEIQLLKKLENVERVIRLFDYEINEEKGVLSVMMELGETDFYKMLEGQLKNDSSKLDITFTRHYWKEMLECVQAVHEHGIVHSDLKPANFLLVKGQLKLIDFGIANAIQDNTVNVHRENQIGTPNYMSPESLVARTPIAGQTAGTKLLKLGRPSDVWSLGCILYQMTYGQPPFAHIKDTIEKIMSIPNPKVEISFPATGIGGSVVPFGLIKTLRSCLIRDQAKRPTIRQLLDDADGFLNPVAISPDMLSRVVGNVVNHCRKREEEYRSDGRLGQEGISCLPREEEMRGWGLAFYKALKEAQEKGTAW